MTLNEFHHLVSISYAVWDQCLTWQWSRKHVQPLFCFISIGNMKVLTFFRNWYFLSLTLSHIHIRILYIQYIFSYILFSVIDIRAIREKGIIWSLKWDFPTWYAMCEMKSCIKTQSLIIYLKTSQTHNKQKQRKKMTF